MGEGDASAGVAEETIRQETGWFVGMDGKWRWEIDDISVRYDTFGDQTRAGAV
ncbi:MAG: hypothetical protein II290_08180 [Oscillospiraceae bacterium]|nr:hypothetical protein [Oscillospiraceae bacterium]